MISDEIKGVLKWASNKAKPRMQEFIVGFYKNVIEAKSQKPPKTIA